MGSSIHPPVTLRLVLTDDLFDALGDEVAQMENRFSPIAPAEAVRARKGSQRENVLRFEIGDAPEEAAAGRDELWRSAMATWLSDLFDEATATAARESQARENRGEPPLAFSWIEVACPDEPPVAIRLEPGSSAPAAAAGYLARAHELLDERAFGDREIAEVRIPSRSSYDAQHAEAVLEAERAPAPDDEDDFQADAVKRDEPTRAEIEQALAEAERELRQAHEQQAGEGDSFDLDYAIWGVEYADGGVQAFDSVTLEPVEVGDADGEAME